MVAAVLPIPKLKKDTFWGSITPRTKQTAFVGPTLQRGPDYTGFIALRRRWAAGAGPGMGGLPEALTLDSSEGVREGEHLARNHGPRTEGKGVRRPEGREQRSLQARLGGPRCTHETASGIWNRWLTPSLGETSSQQSCRATAVSKCEQASVPALPAGPAHGTEQAYAYTEVRAVSSTEGIHFSGRAAARADSLEGTGVLGGWPQPWVQDGSGTANTAPPLLLLSLVLGKPCDLSYPIREEL